MVAATTRTSTRIAARGPDGLDLPVFQEPQQERLHAEAHLPDLVQEQRAAVRDLNLPLLVAVGAGKTALDVAEQLGLQERFGQAAQFTATNGAAFRDNRV